MPEEYTACVLLSNNLCNTSVLDANTLRGMGKNIQWSVIEARLKAIDKDQAWLIKTMEVGANVVTNWKARGVPRGRAPELASLLGVTTDELLGVISRPPSASAPDDLAAQLSRLVSSYILADQSGRRNIMAAADAVDNARTIANQSKLRR